MAGTRDPQAVRDFTNLLNFDCLQHVATATETATSTSTATEI